MLSSCTLPEFRELNNVFESENIDMTVFHDESFGSTLKLLEFLSSESRMGLYRDDHQEDAPHFTTEVQLAQNHLAQEIPLSAFFARCTW